MLSQIFSFFLLLNYLYHQVHAAFDANSKENFVVYWGQASAGSQERLSSYCDDNVDMVIVSFMTAFPGTNNVPTLNFANACYEQYDNGLLHCSKIAADIQTCQDKGIKVLLSLGGASGSYGFSSDDEATKFADTLWDLFGEGSSDTRPFDDAIIDGFDLDIENNNPNGYAALVKQLRTNFDTGSKDYYISAAPQCPNPDASLDDVLTQADVDFAFIQFYNNYCSVTGSSFNFEDWETWVETKAYNKNIKLFLGLPGSTSAAGSGYATPSQIKSAVADIGCSDYFGGISVWDASQAALNEVDGGSFAEVAKEILTSNTCSNNNTSSTISSSTATATSSAASSSVSSADASTTTSSGSLSSTVTPSATNNYTTTYSGFPSSAIPSITTGSSIITGTTSFPASTATSTISTKEQGGSYTSYITTLTSYSTVIVVHPPSSTTKGPQVPTDCPTYSNVSSQVCSLTTTPLPSSSGSPSTTTLCSSNTSSTHGSSSATSTTSGTSTSSSAATPTSSSSPELEDCSGLKGDEKAKCMNKNYSNDAYATTGEKCTDGTIICRASGALAMCNYGSWVNFECAAGTTCYAYTSGNSDDVFTTCNYTANKPVFE